MFASSSASPPSLVVKRGPSRACRMSSSWVGVYGAKWRVWIRFDKWEEVRVCVFAMPIILREEKEGREKMDTREVGVDAM